MFWGKPIANPEQALANWDSIAHDQRFYKASFFSTPPQAEEQKHGEALSLKI